jgi:hypothetical protein
MLSSRKEEEKERAWTVEERRKWDLILCSLWELVRTFPHTGEGEIIADGWREEDLAKTLRSLVKCITGPTRQGNPERMLEQLSWNLRLVQERGNCREWDEFQKKMPTWRK